LPQLMQHLYEQQIQSVLIEGGRFTLEQFIKSGLWDEAIRIVNPDLELEHGTPAPEFNYTPEHTQHMGNNTVEFFRKA